MRRICSPHTPTMAALAYACASSSSVVTAGGKMAAPIAAPAPVPTKRVNHIRKIVRLRMPHALPNQRKGREETWDENRRGRVELGWRREKGPWRGPHAFKVAVADMASGKFASATAATKPISEGYSSGS